VPVPSLDIGLKPSRFYGVGLCLLHLLTYVVVLTAALPPLLLGLVLILVVLLSLRAWLHWRNVVFWRRLMVQENRIRLLGDQRECDAVLGRRTLQAAGLVVLPLHFKGGSFWLPLLPDSLSAEDWRRLRLWLNTRV
jgi:hypothetical protein